ncbi:DNA polymerase IV [Cucumibacter marinus]|uniref:DNA polymerase IV n=1 Tax=Cucumibacter marinus TaxID=1121252 RepID=UPI00040D6275|nr:DNA polymerase IV [Cucumibacter marinus]
MPRTIAVLCRDCDHVIPQAETRPARCPNCHSPRLLAHEELLELSIAHIDCDAFYASVEKRDNPELADKPVIVGGGQRGVVSTCCYIARIDGVRSAMPMFRARRLCPDAIVIRPDMQKYVAVSKQIRTRMDALTPLVEPLSIDEAFLDLSGTQRLFKAPPAVLLSRFAREIEEQIGVTVSVGLSHNKFLAKIASDLDKPRGFAVIGEAETRDFLADKPVSIIYGIGKRFTEKLEKDGLRTVGDIQRRPERDLILAYGEIGARLHRLSQGLDARKINPRGKAKSVSNETTFFEDISDFDELSRLLMKLAESVSARLKKSAIAGDTVTLKLKTAGFKTRTRARQLTVPTQLAHVIYEAGNDLLAREVGTAAFRLIGIGVSGLTDAGDDPVDLVDPGVARKAAAERAMDRVRDKFGKDAVLRGKLYPRNRSGTDNSTPE